MINTSASVLGLEGGETYRHRVRGVRGVGSNRIEGPWSDYVETTLSLPDKITGVTGMPGMNHKEISLSWNADGGTTGYQVRQKKPRRLLPDTWVVLPNEGFDITVDTIGATAVVSNLDPDETYVYQVRGTNVHGEGDWSDDSAEIAVHDERPATPATRPTRMTNSPHGSLVESTALESAHARNKAHPVCTPLGRARYRRKRPCPRSWDTKKTTLWRTRRVLLPRT